MLPPSAHGKQARRLIACVALLLGAVPAAARADDPVWSFEIRDLVEDAPRTHVIHLVPAPLGIHYPRTCKKFVIHVQFVRGKGVPSHLEHYFTGDGYDSAIRQMRDALLDGDLVRLGSLNQGFGRMSGDDKCVVRSAGLAILIGPGQRRAIYSVY